MSKQIGKITFSPTAVTDKEEVHNLHKKYMPEYSAKTKLIEIAPQQTLTVSNDPVTTEDGLYTVYEAYCDFNARQECPASMFRTFIVFINGEKHTVRSANGVEYISDDYQSMGSMAVNGFEIGFYTDCVAAVWDTKYGNTITIAIYEEITEYEKIDAGFMPVLNVFINDDTVDKSFCDIRDAYLKGYVIRFIHDGTHTFHYKLDSVQSNCIIFSSISYYTSTKLRMTVYTLSDNNALSKSRYDIAISS